MEHISELAAQLVVDLRSQFPKLCFHQQLEDFLESTSFFAQWPQLKTLQLRCDVVDSKFIQMEFLVNFLDSAHMQFTKLELVAVAHFQVYSYTKALSKWSKAQHHLVE